MLLRCISAAAAGKPSVTAAARDTDTGRGCRGEGRQQYGGGVRPETPNLQYYIIYSLHVGCGLYFYFVYRIINKRKAHYMPKCFAFYLVSQVVSHIFKSSAVFSVHWLEDNLLTI